MEAETGRGDLGRALLVSLALHGALLSAAWPLLQQVAASRKPLVVALGRPATEKGAAPVPDRAEKKARPAPAKPAPVSQPGPIPGEARVSVRGAVSQGQGLKAPAAALDGSEASAPVASPPPGKPSLDANAVIAAPQVPPSPSGGSGREQALGRVDGAGLRRYRMNLALAAMERFGRDGGRPLPADLRGTVVLRLRRGMGPLTVAVAESSGDPVLDKVARELVQAAGAEASLPPSLGGLDFTFTLRLSFGEE